MAKKKISKAILNQRLKRLYRESGLKQVEFAAQLGISKPALCRYLSGASPNLLLLCQIAAQHRVSPDWLLGRSLSRKTELMAGKEFHQAVLSKRFKMIYRESGLNQVKFAAKVRLTQASVSRYLLGSRPNLTAFIKIARTMEVSTDWLLGFSERSVDPEAETSPLLT